MSALKRDFSTSSLLLTATPFRKPVSAGSEASKMYKSTSSRLFVPAMQESVHQQAVQVFLMPTTWTPATLLRCLALARALAMRAKIPDLACSKKLTITVAYKLVEFKAAEVSGFCLVLPLQGPALADCMHCAMQIGMNCKMHRWTLLQPQSRSGL